jgi:hypothetical protein
VSFFQASAKNSINIKELFYDLVRQMTRYFGGPKKPTAAGTSKKGGCMLL